MKLIADGLLISIFWFIALYTTKKKNLDILAHRNTNNDKEKKILIISQLLILVLIIDEIGLFVNDQAAFFANIRNIMGLPFISHLIYLANLFIIVIAAIRISKSARQKDEMSEKKKVELSFGNGLAVLGISLLLFYLQSVFWGELRYIYTKQGEMKLLYEAIIGGVLIFLPAIIIIINALRYTKGTSVSSQSVRISVPIIVLLSFTQTMITKVIVLFDVFFAIKKAINNKLKRNISKDSDDVLLIASSLANGGAMAKLNAYNLTGYFFTMLILWNSQVSPLPPTYTVYAKGINMSIFFSMAILSFFICEKIARLTGKAGNFFRILFLPTLLILTIYPFYTVSADISTFIKNTQITSIYHTMALSLGSKKYIFFICLTVLQTCAAYIMYIITGESKRNKSYLSIVPIVGLVQVMTAMLMYPFFLSSPPYALMEDKWLIILTLTVFGLMEILLFGNMSYKYFTSKESQWTSIIPEFWKNKKRVYIIVTAITFILLIPIFIHTLFPIKNINIQQLWYKDYIDDETYVVTTMMHDNNESSLRFLANSYENQAKVISVGIEDGSLLWEKEFPHNYVDYRQWDTNRIVLIKVNNEGFTVLNKNTGSVIYDYTINNIDDLEFVNVEVNDRAVLVTQNTNQFVYDYKFGIIELNTLGNNFYKLINGNQCAVYKNSKVYRYLNDRWEAQDNVNYIQNAELIYYDENGMIIFTDDKIYKYSPDLSEELAKNYSIALENITTMNGEYYHRNNNQVTFYLHDNKSYYAYVFDISNFTYKIVLLEQKIKHYNDVQNITDINDKGQYFLYDNYQFTLYNNENLVARQWYKMPLSEEGKNDDDVVIHTHPIILENKMIWITSDGQAHCIIYQ